MVFCRIKGNKAAAVPTASDHLYRVNTICLYFIQHFYKPFTCISGISLHMLWLVLQREAEKRFTFISDKVSAFRHRQSVQSFGYPVTEKLPQLQPDKHSRPMRSDRLRALL